MLLNSNPNPTLKQVLLLLIVLCGPLIAAAKQPLPFWWGNEIGKDEIVLPGYSPLTLVGSTVELGSGRKYVWDKSYLPQAIYAKSKQLVENSYLEVKIGGKVVRVRPDTFTVLENSDHHIILNAEGIVDDVLKISVTSRIEYDGVVMVELSLEPLKPVNIDYFHLVFHIKNNPWMKMLAFKPQDIGKRVNQVVFDPEYSGGYLNAIAMVDGEKSFWVFQDNADQWMGDVNNMTSVSSDKKLIEIKQKLISSPVNLIEPKNIKFNFMATPVKDGVGNQRQNRVARNKGEIEARHHGVHLWWINAFAHQLLPYTEYPEGIKYKISAKDRNVYPGLLKNIKLLDKYERSGIDRLPYFSAHVLNHLDPAYQSFKDKWEIHPIIRWNKIKYDGPFTSLRNDTFLSQRAEGYTDYLIYRYSELIDELGFEGLYFDQGGIRVSANPFNGLWLDFEGKKRGSADILALRNFHKRLATLFYLKGKKGYVVSHNSNDMIIPAYTFATSMVQGEEFNHWLTNYDYIDSIALDELRTRLSGTSYGIPTVWLEVIFAESKRLHKSNRPYEMSKAEWHNSPYYDKAYKNFMALALLHDMPTWSYANLELRTAIMKKIDWVEPENASFTGYWSFPPETFSDKVYYSYYQSHSEDKFLIILSNLSDKTQSVNVNKIFSNMQSDYSSERCKIFDLSLFFEEKLTEITVKSKQFELLPIVCN